MGWKYIPWGDILVMKSPIEIECVQYFMARLLSPINFYLGLPVHDLVVKCTT